MYFLHKAQRSLPALGRVDNTSALGLEAILNSEITNKKHKNEENMATK